MGYLTRRLGPATIAFSLFLAGVVLVWAESYNKGQPVWPAYEGWEKNADGSFNLVFGYMNDNWEEQLDLPVGPGNNIEPGGPDQGQPTHFLPRRNRFMFRIRVPKDFGSQEVVWTLIANKKTTKAYASLRPDLVIENVDIMSETGALGAGTRPKFTMLSTKRASSCNLKLWLPETDTDPNTRLENRKCDRFSLPLTKGKSSKMDFRCEGFSYQ